MLVAFHCLDISLTTKSPTKCPTKKPTPTTKTRTRSPTKNPTKARTTKFPTKYPTKKTRTTGIKFFVSSWKMSKLNRMIICIKIRKAIIFASKIIRYEKNNFFLMMILFRYFYLCLSTGLFLNLKNKCGGVFLNIIMYRCGAGVAQKMYIAFLQNNLHVKYSFRFALHCKFQE